MSKIKVEFTDEFGTVSECSIEQPDFKRQDIVDWFMWTALQGIGFQNPMDGVRYVDEGTKIDLSDVSPGRLKVIE